MIVFTHSCEFEKFYDGMHYKVTLMNKGKAIFGKFWASVGGCMNGGQNGN